MVHILVSSSSLGHLVHEREFFPDHWYSVVWTTILYPSSCSILWTKCPFISRNWLATIWVFPGMLQPRDVDSAGPVARLPECPISVNFVIECWCPTSSIKSPNLWAIYDYIRDCIKTLNYLGYIRDYTKAWSPCGYIRDCTDILWLAK